MNHFLLFLFLPALLSFFGQGAQPEHKKLLLVYAGNKVDRTLATDRFKSLQELANENNFTLDSVRLGSGITERKLQKYDALIFIIPLNEISDIRQRHTLERYVQAGGGLLQISPPPAPESDWLWYIRLQEAGLKAQYVKSFQVADKDQLKHWHTAFDGGLFSQLTLQHTNQLIKDSDIYSMLPDEIRYITNHPALDYKRVTTVETP